MFVFKRMKTNFTQNLEICSRSCNIRKTQIKWILSKSSRTSAGFIVFWGTGGEGNKNVGPPISYEFRLWKLLVFILMTTKIRSYPWIQRSKYLNKIRGLYFRFVDFPGVSPPKSGPVQNIKLLHMVQKLQEELVTSFLRSLAPGQAAQGSVRFARSTFLSGRSVCFWDLRRLASIRRKYCVTYTLSNWMSERYLSWYFCALWQHAQYIRAKQTLSTWASFNYSELII
jgi:hypothetical protein